jgi:hypothetical protein
MMSRTTSRKFYLASVIALILGPVVVYFILLLVAHVVYMGLSGPLGLTVALALGGGVAAILWFIGFIGALVKMARLNQWLWLVLLIFFAPITMLVYIITGPTTPAPIASARAESIPPDALKGGVFFSYRREDSADICGRIYDHLAARYGRLKVFKDVDNIPYGADFPTYIQARLRECAVCLVVIGPKWLTSASADGRRRLDEPGDFVRLEIESALRAGLAVIPVLVYGAGLPPAEALPESLGQLRFLNAAPVRLDPDFATDVRRLCDSIDRVALRPSIA